MFDSSGVINILNRHNESIGTGFFISPEGYVLTCKHVLTDNGYKEFDSILCRYADTLTTFEVEWVEESKSGYDIVLMKATIKHSGNFYTLSSSVGYAGEIKTYGFPNGKKNGIYADAKIDGTVYDPAKKILQTQLGKANGITFGFSGAPALSLDGTVVGIISGIPKQDDNNRLSEVAFAIPASSIMLDFSAYFVVESEVDIYSSANTISIVGRKMEISHYSKQIRENSVTVIQGMAGVGKTTLAIYLYETIITTPKLWITIKKDINNNIENIIYDICTYLARYGYPKPINMFCDLKNSSQPYEIALTNLQQEIVSSILNINLTIFVDDAHLINNQPEAIKFFALLIMKCCKNKLVFITRHALDFVPISLNGNPLSGLSKEDCQQLLKKSGLELTESQLADVYNKTQGNAKFLEVCIFSLLERDKRTINEVVGELATNFSLQQYIENNIKDRFTPLESKILSVVALCRKPIQFSLLLKLLPKDSFESIYLSLDRFVRRNIIDKTKNDSYDMHALLKKHFSRIPAAEMLLLHHQIAENLSDCDFMEISYHYASCGRISKALSILIASSDELISKGFVTTLYNQIISYQQLVQKEEEIPYYYLLGKLDVARGQYEDAISVLRKVEVCSNDYAFDCYILLCQCFEKIGFYPSALMALDDAEKCMQINNIVQKSVIDINKGFILCHQEKIQNGIYLCEKGLYSLEMQSSLQNLVSDGYNNLGWNYTIQGKYKKAISSLSKAIELYSNDARGASLAKIRLARINWQMGHLRPALKLIAEAENLANLTGDPQLQAFSLRQKNLILWNCGDFENSLRGHKDSLKIYSSIKDYWGIAASLENIAAVLYDLGHFKKALKYIDNAVKVCEKIQASDFLAYAYLYKSRILVQQGSVNLAISFAKRSFSLLHKWKYSSYYSGMALISLGIAYLAGKKVGRAIFAFRVAKAKLHRGKAFFQEHVAEFYLLLCKKDFDFALYSKCYGYFDSIGAHKFTIYLKNIEYSFRSNFYETDLVKNRDSGWR